jgi:IS5 family transposase
VPDHSTFWCFRNLLKAEGLYEILLDEINQQLMQQGLLIRHGEPTQRQALSIR